MKRAINFSNFFSREPAVNESKDCLQKNLFEACKKGDPKAQLQIYKLYYKTMFNVSLNIVEDPVMAENIMQEAFLIAFEKINTFSGRMSFPEWLKKQVWDSSMDFWRRSNIQIPYLNSI